jgi:hypothetical protein
MIDTSSMTMGEAEACRKGLAEGFEQARERAIARAISWTGSNTPAVNNTAQVIADTIRTMEPPA